MANLPEMVWEFLDGDPCIRRNMRLGLINKRALARHILEAKNIDSKLDAALSAIRRYESESSGKIFENAYKLIKESTSISTKSPLANISLKKDADVQKLLPKLFSIIQYSQGHALRIIQADKSIKILVDEKNLEDVKKIFPKDKIIEVEKNLAELNIHIPEQARHAVGIMAITTNELAVNGINILESMTCISELLWFVEGKDLLKAYNVLNQLWHFNEKN